jgi:hypothetical protein
MIHSVIIVTNNPIVLENFKSKYAVHFIEEDVLDVYKEVRDYIHLNHKLLTHPLISSIKPNEVPYRTVLISKTQESSLDLESLEIIENSIASTLKFLKDFGIPNWNENILKDFQLIDFDIINNVFK